tara:strand:- start:67 stop:531 length:465 start_codon:yes stop_codon:yes gene_type:complete
MARITVEDCIDKFESRFELVLVASNRARKLHTGEKPTVEKDNDKNTVIALREIAEETISIDKFKNSLIEEYQTVSPQNQDSENLDFDDSEYNSEDKTAVENNTNSDKELNLDIDKEITEDDNISENDLDKKLNDELNENDETVDINENKIAENP